MTLAPTIAKFTASAVGHQVAAQRGTAMREALLCNEHVAADLWRELYQTKGPAKVTAKVAKEAVTATMCGDRVKHVMDVESRGSILAAMFKDVYPDPTLLAEPAFAKVLSDAKMADNMHRRYGPVLDHDALAQMPAESLGGPLRVWRLLSDTLTDAEVLSELLSFDAWGTTYIQRPLGWVLHRRPQLLTDLVGKAGGPVMTQAAGSARLGVLSADEQVRLLGVAENAEDCSSARANALLYAWMAAASNPTLSMDALDAVEAHMVRADREFNPSSVAINRRNTRPWTVPSLVEEVDADTMAGLVRWSAPRNGKTRVGAMLDLLDNPSFYPDDAEVAAENILDELRTGRGDGSVLVGAPGTELLEAFTQVFPDVAAQHQLAQTQRDRQVSLLGITEAQRRGFVVDTHTVHPSNTRPVDPAVRVRYSLGLGEIAWIDERVGDSEQGWEMVYTMVDTLADETLDHFVDTCLSLTL